MKTIIDALQSLRPGAEWSLHGDNYAGLEWFDKSQSKPTEAEVNAEITRLEAEWQATEYQRKRTAEYPDFREYLDGIIKGDQAQIQAYINACLAVKAKYPKGQA
jgi:hypothetical protein